MSEFLLSQQTRSPMPCVLSDSPWQLELRAGPVDSSHLSHKAKPGAGPAQ